MKYVPQAAAEYRTMFEVGNVRKFLDVYWENFRSNWPGIKGLNGVRRWRGMRQAERRLPVVLAAAGPSLERVLPALAANKGRFLLVTVDAARDRLLAAGVRPHVTVTVDPQQLVARYFENYARGQLVLACAWQHPDLFRIIPPQDTVVFTERLTPGHMVHKLFWKDVEYKHMPSPDWFGRLTTGGAVGNTAVALAYWIRATELIIVGMDLCWRPENGPLDQRADYKMVDMNGDAVETSIRYHQPLLLLKEACAAASSCRVINATGAGLLYGSKGIEVMSIEQALEQCAAPVVNWEYQLRRRMKIV